MRSRLWSALVALGLTAAVLAVPAATSTAAAAAPLSCDGVTAGQYVPGAATTGVHPAAELVETRPAGGILYADDGAVLENLDVYGVIKLRADADDVTIRNVRVRGFATAPAGSQGLIMAYDRDIERLTIEGVTLRPDVPAMLYSGVLGHDYTARCVDVSETTDGFGVYNSGYSTATATAPTNVTITQSYCHELAGWSPSTDADNKSHTDCVQAQGARGLRITYNHLSAMLSATAGTLAANGYAGCPAPKCTTPIPADPGYMTTHPQALSAVMVNRVVLAGQTVQPADWEFTGNRVSGGEVPFNAGDDRLVSVTLGTACGNTFVDDAWRAGQTFWLDPDVTLDTCDDDPRRNIFAHAVTVKRNA